MTHGENGWEKRSSADTRTTGSDVPTTK